MNRILITGGSGFLGRRIAEEARSQGYDVLDPRSKAFDLESGKGVGEYFAANKPEAVIHSAAYYGGIGICKAEPLNLAARNLRMSANLFDFAAKAGVAKIVSIGSTCAYPGNMPDADMREEDIFSGRCHDSVEAYGFSKRAQLVLMAAAHKQFGTSCTQIALTNLYGEHDVFHEYRAHAIAALIKKITDAKAAGSEVHAWGTGMPVRQFLYVGDAARVIIGALKIPHDDWPVNIGGEAVSIRNLAEMIAEFADFPPEKITWDPSKPDGVARKVVNESKLRNLFPGYRPMPFREGLRKTVQWYLENKSDADRRR